MTVNLGGETSAAQGPNPIWGRMQPNWRNYSKLFNLPSRNESRSVRINETESLSALRRLGNSRAIPKQLIDRLNSFENLPQGWDGEDANAVDKNSWTMASELIYEIHKIISPTTAKQVSFGVSPTYDGGIQIELVFGGRALSIVLDPMNHFYAKMEPSDGSELFEENKLGNPKKDVYNLVPWLMGKVQTL